MVNARKTFIGAVVAVTALAVFGANPAQGGPGDGKEPVRGALAAPADDGLAPDRGPHAKAPASLAARAALAAIQARIARYVDAHGTAYSFASYLDATTGKIVLSSDAPVALVASLTALSGVSAAEMQAARQAQVRRSTVRDLYHRRDDLPSFWGGAGLSVSGGLCSSGYAVLNGAGTVFATTAGHCYADGATVQVESGARDFGTVSDRNLPTVNGQPRDVELLGGLGYEGRLYTGPACCPVSSVPVFAAGEASEGFTDYCHSGRTTGENCGHTATSITGQVCTATGCKSPVIVFNGGVQPQSGDSGSPFYAMDDSGRAWIRGHVIAGGGTTSFAEKWTEVSALLGVSIRTG